MFRHKAKQQNRINNNQTQFKQTKKTISNKNININKHNTCIKHNTDTKHKHITTINTKHTYIDLQHIKKPPQHIKTTQSNTTQCIYITTIMCKHIKQQKHNDR